MKKIFTLLLLLTVLGCSEFRALIPSKFDGNEARIMTDIQMSVRYFDCSNPKTQINDLQREINWLQTYSSFRGSRDILSVTEILSQTVNEFKSRSDTGPISVMYCDLKKKILIQQADITAKAVQGRF